MSSSSRVHVIACAGGQGGASEHRRTALGSRRLALKREHNRHAQSNAMSVGETHQREMLVDQAHRA